MGWGLLHHSHLYKLPVTKLPLSRVWNTSSDVLNKVQYKIISVVSQPHSGLNCSKGGKTTRLSNRPGLFERWITLSTG